MDPIVAIIAIPIRGLIGYFIGRNRKIGPGWSFALGAILGLIGWIIAACSKKSSSPEFDDMSQSRS